MRKVQSVKKKNYLFHIPYEGKDASLDDWRRLVNVRSTQTLKFMNLSRILKIINYDPSQYMNPQKMQTLKQGKRSENDYYYDSLPDQGKSSDASKKNNVGYNLF